MVPGAISLEGAGGCRCQIVGFIRWSEELPLARHSRGTIAVRCAKFFMGQPRFSRTTYNAECYGVSTHLKFMEDEHRETDGGSRGCDIMD